MKECKINELGVGECYPCMGCRSFLTPDRTISLGNIAKAKNYKEGVLIDKYKIFVKEHS